MAKVVEASGQLNAGADLTEIPIDACCTEQGQAIRLVLVVEDDEPTGRLLTRLVKSCGYRAFYAANGSDALDFLQSAVPNLVILDVMMPGVDGLEVLQRMRADPRTRDVPVIVFSAVGDPEFQENVIAKGATAYWVKSTIDFRTLGNQLRQYLTA